MTRATTAPEKVLLRTEGQKSQMFFDMLTPDIVFSAQINQTFDTHNEVAELIYNNVTFGAYTDILLGTTLYIGSAAGLYDLGMIRIRKTPTSSVIYIGEVSDVDFADDLYLTVVDEMQPWAKHLRIVDEVVYIDYDVPYSDQHTDMDPIPILGATFTPLQLVAGTVDYSPPDASLSYVLGSTISSHSWGATGGSVINETTSTPTFTFTVAGNYRIWDIVTAANGKSTTGYRYIKVTDANNPPIDVVFSNCVGTGSGWQFSVVITGDSSTIRERSLCMLYTKDWYGDTQQSIGQQSGNESTLAVGWIVADSIVVNPEQGSVSFKVQSADYWLDKIASFPTGFKNVSGVAAEWIEFNDLTVDKASWHLLHWRSTITSISDVTLTEDIRLASALESSTGSLWNQLKSLSFEAILSEPRVDRYGGLFLQIDSQYLAEVDRSSIPIVMDIESQDWIPSVSIPEVTVSSIARVELSGISYDGSDGVPYFSRANGDIFKQHGSITTQDRLLLEDQAQANILAGLVINKANNKNPKVRISMNSNFRMSDIAPLQYNTLTIAAEDTLRGIVWTQKKIIPRRIQHTYNSITGILLTSIEHEAEIFEGLSITYDRPQTPIDSNPPIPGLIVPDWPLFSFGGLGSFGGVGQWIPQDIDLDPDDTCPDDLSASANGPWNLWIRGELTSTMRPASLYGYMWAIMRIGTATNKSSYVINAQFQERIIGNEWIESTDADWYTVYPIDSNGNRLTAGTKDAISSQTQRTGFFNMPAASVFRHVEVAINGQSYSIVLNSPSIQFGNAPVLAWTKLGLSSVDVDPFEGGILQSGSSNYNCYDPTPISGSADATLGAKITLNGSTALGAVEITANFYGTGQTPFTNPTIRIASYIVAFELYDETTDGYAASAEYVQSPLNSIVSITVSADTDDPQLGIYSIFYSVTVRQVATKRILFDSVFLYNLCPRPFTG